MTIEGKAAIVLVACVLVLALYGESTRDGSGGNVQKPISKTRTAVIIKAGGKAREGMLDDLEYFNSNKVEIIGRINRAITSEHIEELRRLDHRFGFIEDTQLQEALVKSREIVAKSRAKD
ncbi:hypothetical protein [Pseudoteredinibacter isoporae]|uniref:Uncharacterized protein n=1 Tax=Pseudoteredinibacter isoporae TaxID=570281 RepID=A0A7X0MY94_9GAMM|nr:hypothetical protein [Pseudoteredinibacter isoporae]MBB6521777.1 hypothetical protein [Pseudoteredinibacter isoporae]NHO87324.1 hypothetical protein [Pseudoteredinibacter isoporae]NIB23044.1 hypothetical protein [Pseudoteredinibacter isoporae]